MDDSFNTKWNRSKNLVLLTSKAIWWHEKTVYVSIQHWYFSQIQVNQESEWAA